MENTTDSDLYLDSSNWGSDSGAVGFTNFALKLDLDPSPLDTLDWTKTGFASSIGSGSAHTPFTCGNETEPMLLDVFPAVEFKPAPLFPRSMLSSSNLKSYHNILDLTSYDESSPPSRSMSSTSSSESFSYSSSNDSTPKIHEETHLFSTPTTLEEIDLFTIPMTRETCQPKSLSTPMARETRQVKTLKRPSIRPSLPAISQQKLDVIKNALIFHNPKPTADQSSFLAKSLHLDDCILELWLQQLLMEGIGTLKGPKSRKPLKSTHVASWKQTIIRRGLQNVNAPSGCQIEFLAAGLRIRVEQLWQSLRVNVNNGLLVEAESRGKIEDELSPTTRLPKWPLPLSNNKGQLANSIVKTAIKLNNSAITLPSKPLGVGVGSLDSPPWDPLMKPEMKTTGPIKVSDVKSQNCQHLQSIVNKKESVPECKQSSEKASEAVEIHATSSIGDTNMESIDEEVSDLSPEEELTALLGPEYGHLAESIFSRFAATNIWDQCQFASSPRQHTGGVENTLSSNSSQTSGNASSPNTSASGSNNGKRKSPGDGGEGPGELEPNDGDGNMNPPPPKKVKTPQIRYDCPIFRRSLMVGSTVRSCALNGLEFRNLWDHLRKAHYGCEICGLKLDGKRDDKTHLREREKNASICHTDLRTGATFDVGIDLFAELEEVYDNRTLSPQDKWKQWWKLLFPDAGEAPDPRHHDTISISTANIPAFQESFHNMWRENQVLPALDEIQQLTVSTLLDKLLRTAPIIQRYRHQSMQPRTPRTPATAANMQAVAYTAGQSPSYSSNAQDGDYNWSQGMLPDLNNAFGSDAQSFPGNGNLSYETSTPNSYSQEFGDNVMLSFRQNS